MDLDQVQVELRPRSNWEAIDLGSRMLQRWALALYGSWALVTAPLLLLCLPVFDHLAIWVTLLLWWLKPLFERLTLIYASRAVFGQQLALPGALRAWRQSLQLGDVLAVLTWRRLSPTRALDQPLFVLEGLSGRERNQRLALLHRGCSGTMTTTMLLLVHVELFLVSAGLGLLEIWVPQGVDLDPLALLAQTDGVNWVMAIGYWLAVLLVGPLHACCGFALYLNRRVDLEGWDLEIGFRRLARRVAGALPGLLLVAVALLAGLAPTPAMAGDGAEAPGAGVMIPVGELPPETSRQAIAEVLAAPEFHQRQVQRYLVWPALAEWWQSLFGVDDDGAVPDLTWLPGVLDFIASSLQFVLWVVLVSMVIWLLYHYRHWLMAALGQQPDQGPLPQELFGMDVSAESLPDDLPAAVRSLWAAGDQRGALALLYRAALVSSMHSYGCRFRASDTEGECLVRARHVLPDQAGVGLAVLTTIWQRQAYGHLQLGADDLEQALQHWQDWFAQRPAAGQRLAGPHSAGPHSAGPHSAGLHSAGPHSAGPREPAGG